jgi:hypothetical protein
MPRSAASARCESETPKPERWQSAAPVAARSDVRPSPLPEGTNRAGDQAIAVMHAIQPYVGGNLVLRAIHDLDIQDKHTAIIPTLMNVGGPILSRWDDDGTPNLSFVGDPTAPSELRIVFPAQGPLGSQEIINTLKDCVQVTEAVIELFRVLTEIKE